MTKVKVIDALKELPDQFEIDALFDKLILINKIEAGLEDETKGKLLTEEELETEIDSW
jgi:predicted transcriptional regulator